MGSSPRPKSHKPSGYPPSRTFKHPYEALSTAAYSLPCQRPTTAAASLLVLIHRHGNGQGSSRPRQRRKPPRQIGAADVLAARGAQGATLAACRHFYDRHCSHSCGCSVPLAAPARLAEYTTCPPRITNRFVREDPRRLAGIARGVSGDVEMPSPPGATEQGPTPMAANPGRACTTSGPRRPTALRSASACAQVPDGERRQDPRDTPRAHRRDGAQRRRHA